LRRATDPLVRSVILLRCAVSLLCRIADIMDITSEDFVNKNLYEFCHAEDLQKLHKAHVDCKYAYN